MVKISRFVEQKDVGEAQKEQRRADTIEEADRYKERQNAQGQKVKLAIQFTKQQGFAGSCRAQLVNLPRGITASSPEIQANTKSVTLDVTLGPKATLGRHRNLRLRLQVPTAGGAMLHEFRGGEIRVDRAQPRKAPAQTGKRL